MNLHARLLTVIGAVLLFGFGLIEYFTYQTTIQESERVLLREAEKVRAMAMATRRIYHKQFLDSNLPLTPDTVGFLPAHAMNRISKDLANWDDSGFSVNNVSDRPRNPNQAADDIELKAMEIFRQDRQEKFYFTHFIKEDGNHYYLYARPIWVEQYCLKCHGKQSEAPETIKEMYDTAYDYKVGDLRGILSIKLPASSQETFVWESFKATFIYHMAIFAALFLSVLLVTRWYVLNPLDSVTRVMASVADGKYHKRVEPLPGEFATLSDAFNDMAKKIASHKMEMITQRNIFDTILSNTPQLVVLKDREFVYKAANEAFCRFIGRPEEEVLGKTDFDLFPYKEALVYRNDDKRILETLEPQSQDEEVMGEEGKRWLHVTKTPVLSGSGEGIALLCTVNDVTERKLAEVELREAKEKAEDATKEKDKYVSLIAHDLKAPYTSLIAFLRLMKNNMESEWLRDKKGLLDSMLQNTERSVNIIDDVLHATRFETGSIKLKPRFMDAHIACFISVSNLGHLAREKGIKIESRVPENSRLFADTHLLGEVLDNIVGNAIKFCGKGDEIILFVPEGMPTAIAVRDTGVGIAPDMIPNLFRHDVKTTTVGTAGETGTGLALPLCKEIIEAHGGELAVESVENEGSVFYISLPYVKPRILVADDERVVRYTLASHLQGLDVEIVEVDDGVLAMKTIKETEPALILLDIYLPNVSGFDIIKELKANGETKDIPVIFITSDNRIETRDKALRLGADDFIPKPIMPEDLIPRIRKFIA